MLRSILEVTLTGGGGVRHTGRGCMWDFLSSTCRDLRLLALGGARAHLGTCLPLNVEVYDGIPSTGHGTGHPYHR
jgi:hypothetical protein